MIKKAINIIRRRLKEQGLYTTMLWLYGRGIPLLTGRPLLQYCEVTPQLFVGSQFRSQGLKYLESRGIDHIVNLRIEKDDRIYGVSPEKYCYLPTVDDEAPITQHLDDGVRFIRAQNKNGKNVFIPGGGGGGRPPTMAAAYLISTGLTLADALQRIRKARPFITITQPQMRALIAYAENRHSAGSSAG
jgi:protein-tyrosine phosphatase